jgi:hypothetical protein
MNYERVADRLRSPQELTLSETEGALESIEDGLSEMDGSVDGIVLGASVTEDGRAEGIFEVDGLDDTVELGSMLDANVGFPLELGASLD